MISTVLANTVCAMRKVSDLRFQRVPRSATTNVNSHFEHYCTVPHPSPNHSANISQSSELRYTANNVFLIFRILTLVSNIYFQLYSLIGLILSRATQI